MIDYYPTWYAAKFLNMTSRALMSARRNGKLEGLNIAGRWHYSLKTLIDYQNQRWFRNPKLSEGELTVHDVMDKYKVKPQELYYFLYSRKIPYEKRLNIIIVKEINIKEFVKLKGK